MTVRAWMLFLLWVCTFGAAHAETFTAKVIAVLDGDTVLALRNAQKIKVRLANIDAPEVGHAGMGGQPPNSQKAQEYGMASRQSLVEMVLRKQVQVNSQATDEYGRMVAQIEAGGLKVNEEQVRRGMAWEYSHFHSDRHYIALQREAQQEQRGLWAQANPTPPWEWRKTHAAAQPPQHIAAQGYTCGSKRRCSQMSSCSEAHFYLTHCGVKSLDRNGDGVPCENICGGKK